MCARSPIRGDRQVRGSSHVPVLCCLIDELIKSREDVVCKLDLGNRAKSLRRKSNSESGNALFA